MSLVINHNLMASNVARSLSQHFGKLGTSTQRLSSGLRINSSADDAAGLAIRELQRAEIRTLGQGARNANDAISLIQTADGALAVIDEKLIRMKELAEQAATGTYDSTQRIMIDNEFQAMALEIDRIASSTKFNGIYLLNGNLSGIHDGSNLMSDGAMKIHFGLENDAKNDYYFLEIPSVSINSLFNDTRGVGYTTDYYSAYNTGGSNNIIGIDITTTQSALNMIGSATFEIAYKTGPPSVSGDGASKKCWIEVVSPGVIDHDFLGYKINYDSASNTWSIVNGDPLFSTAVIINYSNGCAIDLDNFGGSDIYIYFDSPLNADTEVTFDMFNGWSFTKNNTQYNNPIITALTPVNLDIQFGIDFDNSGGFDFIGRVINIGNGSTYNAVIGFNMSNTFTISTQDTAQNMLNKIDDAITKKDNVRASLGAMQNRLENTISNLNIQAENLQASESRISDTDVAMEMTEMVQNQILSQAATAMLAQANSLPKMALQLMSG